MSFSYPRGNIEFEFQGMKVLSGFQLEKGVNYSSNQNCVWTCHFVSGRKMLTSLLVKCRRMTQVQPNFHTILKTDQPWTEVI